MSTSAPQIEGAAGEDGKGRSIWDTFASHPGRIADGSTPEVAADHYHRTREDIALMKELGVRAYRFSVAWPRVIPDGVGTVNPAGLDFYDRLVDDLLAAGIEPWVCLYHWDLPQPLEDLGGWDWRGVIEAFARYAEAVGARLADRAAAWLVLNESSTFAIQGHLLGVHAPGKRGVRHLMRAIHFANVAQGMGFRALKATGARRVGTALVYSPVYPASPSARDVVIAARVDELAHGMFLHPVLEGGYPQVAERLLRLADVRDVDERIMRVPLDFIGVNYYRPLRVAYDLRIPIIKAREVPHALGDAEYTASGWEVAPRTLRDGLVELWEKYRLPLVITENGAAYNDVVRSDGVVDDPRRVRFLASHIDEVGRAIDEGARVDGYFVWSLLDNFEWADGYAKRFGIVYVDFDTQVRTVKSSGRFFAQVIEGSVLPEGCI